MHDDCLRFMERYEISMIIIIGDDMIIVQLLIINSTAKLI